MNSHLNTDEIQTYIDKGETGLSSNRVLHLKGCKKCRQIVDEQKGMHRFLHYLQPQHASRALYNGVIRRIENLPKVSGKDWTLFISMTILILISLTIIFSDGMPEQQVRADDLKLPKLSVQKTQEIDNQLRMFMNSLGQQAMLLMSKLRPYMLIIFALITVMFYYIFDRYFLHSLIRQFNKN